MSYVSPYDPFSQFIEFLRRIYEKTEEPKLDTTPAQEFIFPYVGTPSTLGNILMILFELLPHLIILMVIIMLLKLFF